MKVTNGSRETLRSRYDLMNQKSAGNRMVFCSWGDGIDETIPDDNLRKYEELRNGQREGLGSRLLKRVKGEKRQPL